MIYGGDEDRSIINSASFSLNHSSKESDSGAT